MTFYIFWSPYKPIPSFLIYFRASKAFILVFLSRHSTDQCVSDGSVNKKLRVTQQLTAISNGQRQHLSCIVSMVLVTHALSDIYIMKNLCRLEKFKDTEKVIRYHPLGISSGTDIVFGILVAESTVGSTEIPNFIRYSHL